MKYIILSISLLLFFGCKNDDDKGNEPANNKPTVQSQITTNVEQGSWKITNFNEDGKDETQNFLGYVFTFKADGTVTADNSENTYSGTWSITDSNSSDDSQDDLHFNINFDLSNDFQDLNDDWEFISNSETKIELKDVSGGNGGIDLLTFEKN